MEQGSHVQCLLCIQPVSLVLQHVSTVLAGMPLMSLLVFICKGTSLPGFCGDQAVPFVPGARTGWQSDLHLSAPRVYDVEWLFMGVKMFFKDLC